MTRASRFLAACAFVGPLMLAAPASAQAPAQNLAPVPARAPALQAPVGLQGNGPFYRLALPAAVYSLAGFEDLRDLRVRNASGQPVPFAWLDAEADARADAAPPPIVSLRAPLFALPTPSAPAAGGADDAALLGFKLRTDGSLALAPLSTAKPATSTASAWLIDASQVKGALVQARFELAPGALGLFPFTLEASDDLRGWRRMGSEEQLVRLQQAGQTIERLALDIDHLHARFLRLRWREPAAAPALAGVWLDSVAEAEPVAALEWSAEVPPSACTTDHCDYAVPRGWPLQSLRVALAEPNTLAPLHITSLVTAATPMRPPRNALYVLRHGRDRDRARGNAAQELTLAETVVYRLTQPGGEARSAPVALDGASHTTLRLRSNGPISALGSRPPSLAFGARPRTLVFLAQGQPPFVLSGQAAGQPLARDLPGALALATLLPNRRPDAPLALDTATVTLPASTLPAPAAPMPTAGAAAADRKPWLWAALGASLLLLAAMAVSLLRSLKSPQHLPD